MQTTQICFFEAKDLNNCITEVNKDLAAVAEWCKTNKLTLNLEKTNYIVFKNHQNTRTLAANSIKFYNQPITQVDSVRFLGVYFDENLTWKAHIDQQLKTLRPSVSLMYRISKYLPKQVLIIFYNSFILSKLSYCIEVWGSAAETHTHKILLFQKKIVRNIYQTERLASSDPLFRKTNIFKINELYNYKLLIKAHKTFYSSTSHHHIKRVSTRSSTLNLSFPKSTTSSGHRRVSYQMAALWNGLPDNLRSVRSQAVFRVALKRHLLALRCLCWAFLPTPPFFFPPPFFSFQLPLARQSGLAPRLAATSSKLLRIWASSTTILFNFSSFILFDEIETKQNKTNVAGLPTTIPMMLLT